MYKTNTPYLITTSAYFFGPDGQRYSSAWGYIKIHAAKDILGFEPTRSFANWYMEVTCNEQSVFIARCQVMYSVECPEKPFISNETFVNDKGVTLNYNSIYISKKII